MVRLILAFFALVSLLACTSYSEERPPNVVIIFTDDQGYQDVGCFGSPDILTPYLDQMAKEGVRLTHFLSAQAVCSASRAGLLTGCYPNRIGIHNAFMPKSKKGLHHNETTIAEMLKPLGYKTGIFGKWHLGDHPDFMPLNHGFDEYFGIPYSNDMWPFHPQQGPVFNFGPLPLYENHEIIDTLEDQTNLTVEITNRSLDFIRRNKDHPFFLYVPHPQPHVPLFVSDQFRGSSERGLYGDVIMEIDWSVGQILVELDKHDLRENTIVIFTSDNGPWLSYGNHSGSALPLREGKGTAWEGGQREPFILRFPRKIEPNTAVDIPIMAIDLLPSIAHWTGAKLPTLEIDGKNVAHLIDGSSSENPHEAYFYYYRTNELHAVRSGDWKLYFPHAYRSLNGRPGGLDGLPANYDQNVLNEAELYNVHSDVSEVNNVIQDHPEIAKRLSALADLKRAELGDNLKKIEGFATRKAGIAEWN